jgi:hypothetical protein
MSTRTPALFAAILAAVLLVANDGRRSGAQEAGPKEATLTLNGEPGTEFSGSCAVGGAKDELGGRVPQQISYRFVGEKLECEVHQRSAGALEVVLESGDDRSEQRISSQGNTIKFSYSENSFFSSTTSSSGSVVSQQSSSSSSGSS